MALEFSKNLFDGVPISMSRSLKSETSSGQCSVEVLSAIDEKHDGFDIVFLAEFSQEDFGYCGCCRRKESEIEQLVCIRICCGVQPELLIIDSMIRITVSSIAT